jgi:hypothetical protein
MIIKLVQTPICSADWTTSETAYKLRGKRGEAITIFSRIPTANYDQDNRLAEKLLIDVLCTDPTSLTLAYDTTVPNYWVKYLTLHHYDYLITNHPEILL